MARKSIVFSSIFALMLAIAVSGCGQQLKQENEKLKGQVQSLTDENNTLKGQVESVTKERDDLKGQAASLTQERDTLKQELEAAKAKPAPKKKKGKK